MTSLAFYFGSYSQTTTTIVYSTSSLVSTKTCLQCCNTFNQSSNTTVGGVKHRPVSGGATFDSVYIRMNTRVNTPEGVNSGTAYAMEYACKVNYTYKIDSFIARKESDPFAVAPKVTFSMRTALPNPNETDPDVCGAVNNSKWMNSIGTYIAGVIYVNDTATKNYTVSPFGVPIDQSYLVVTVSEGGSNYTTASIKKIVITETAPRFSVTSSVSSIDCGTTPPITFTINNLDNAIGITAYTFDLGPNNGWLYNGFPAPATIPAGTTNTVTLTPDCGKALSGVKAIVTARGINFNSINTATIATPVSLSIGGNTLVCSGSTTYTMNGLPCNASITWTSPPAAQGSLNPLNSSPTTFTYGGTPGNFTLSAEVIACGATKTVTLPVHAGPYTYDDYTITWNAGTPPYYCLNKTITFTLNGPFGSNYNWSVPIGWTLLYNGGSYAVLKTPTSTGYPPTGSVTVTFTEPCGNTITKSFQTVYSSSYCGSSGSPYTISPNPASSTITIACTNLQTYCNISSVQITDLYGQVKASQSWPYTNQSVQMNVSFLPNGTYIAKVYDGSQWYSNQFIVQH